MSPVRGFYVRGSSYYRRRFIKCSIKENYRGYVIGALMLGMLVISIESAQVVSPVEVDYIDSSKMNVDVSPKTPPYDSFCLTEGCYNAAELIRSNINEAVDPCNNFFEFACGGFVHNAVVSDSKPATGRLDEVQEKVLQDIAKLLVEEIDDAEPRIVKLSKQYFKTCLYQPPNDNVGPVALSEIVAQLGGWPVLLGDNWQEDTFGWAEMDIKLRKFGFIPQNIMKFYVFNDLYNSSRNLLHIAPPTLDLNPKILNLGFNNERVQIFYNFMINVAVYFGADRERATQELADVLGFELQLASAASAIYSSPFKNFTIQDLEINLPIVPWYAYLNGLVEPDAHLEVNDVIRVENPNYLNQLVVHLIRTPKRTIANYMIWRIVHESIPFLNIELHDMYTHFVTAFTGKKAEPIPRWKECARLLISKDKGLTVGVSSLYIRRVFDDKTRSDVRDIVHSIGDEFKLVLLKLPWLDDTAKINAIRKSLFMKQIVGYPDQLKNDKVINEYSRGLEIDPNNFFINVLRVKKFHYEYSISGLMESIDKRAWLSFADSTTINAYYYSVFNSFVLLAAFLQPPLFNHNWPSYVKYGSIGFIIGHETMHAYDAGRIFYDETGSYNPQFSDVHQIEYAKRISCYIRQYGQFRDDELGIFVDGKLTVNENLADNVGIYVAYKAYKKWEAEHLVEDKLPGLRYTQEQLFWISSANFLCSKETAERRMNLLLTEEHTPDKFRALGHVSNLDEFAKAFNCPRNSPMNPEEKCSLL